MYPFSLSLFLLFHLRFFSSLVYSLYPFLFSLSLSFLSPFSYVIPFVMLQSELCTVLHDINLSLFVFISPTFSSTSFLYPRPAKPTSHLLFSSFLLLHPFSSHHPLLHPLLPALIRKNAKNAIYWSRCTALQFIPFRTLRRRRSAP